MSAEQNEQRRRPWLVIASVVIALAASRAAVEVVLPCVWAALAAFAAYPFFERIQRHLPRWFAALCAMLLLVAVFGVIGAGLGYCAAAFSAELDAGQLQGQTLTIAGHSISFADVQSRVMGDAEKLGRQLAASAIGSILMLALATLGLMEVPRLRVWLGKAWSDSASTQATRVFTQFGTDVRRYLLVRTLLGLLTGGMVTLLCWLLGIRLSLVWGITNFLLNYIPTVGSILGVVPPTAFAFAQSGSVADAGLALAAVGGVQIVMGNWVDPLLQGKYLKMSPTVVLLAVTFWGWLWGPWGAFVGVPLTIFVARAAEPFPESRWITSLCLRSETEAPNRSEPRTPVKPSAPCSVTADR